MTGPDHERYRDDAGCYLLGAMADAERAAFEAHLEACPDCREEVERLRPAADALPRAVEQMTPPTALKASLMDVVHEEAQRSVGERRTLAQRLGALLPGGRVLRPALVAGAFALAAAAGYGAAQLGAEDDGQRTVQASVDSRRLELASASLTLSGDGEDGGVLRAEDFPRLERGRVYQAWIQRGKAIIPQPTFEVDASGDGGVAVLADLSDADAVLVTRERRGGARQPSEAPVLQVSL